MLVPLTVDFDEEEKSDSQWQSEEGRNAIGQIKEAEAHEKKTMLIH